MTDYVELHCHSYYSLLLEAFLTGFWANSRTR